MAKSKTVRVYPDGNVWVVKRDGVGKAAAIRDTKKEALEVAREIALNQGISITIHGRDGKIQRKVWPNEEPDEGCFITTACVNYFGLEDNCYQLVTLRAFRDIHLLRSPDDEELVKEYYLKAPLIVSLLEKDSNRRVIYEWIFENINRACASIQIGDYESAKNIYKDVVLNLAKHFRIN